MEQIEVHLYGKLRRYAPNPDPREDSILLVTADGKTIAQIVEEIGIDKRDLGANIFLNGEYSDLGRVLHSGDRVGLFPDDMQLLYKWYFARRK
ncbi:MoaD/ThiS family protein [Candidatus Bipolaricaulota bacterium]|nr:MoaD/ThiS family protein [Candidatus Bipolaricaulota bacterium]